MLISGAVTLLMQDPSLQKARPTFEELLAATKRASSVTKQLLTFSRKQPEAAVDTDLNLIVLNLERMLRMLLSEQIQLEVSISPAPQPVHVDVSQIEMMIMNMAVNAQDAMPEGGTLSVTTSSETRSLREERANKSTRVFAVLEITDTGHGMTPEVRSRIFEPFFTTKQLGKGTGLGLSTVLGIVERAGGHVEVTSEPKRGSTFRVYLPQVTSPGAQLISSSTLPDGGGSETILLAEDESGIRAMTRTYLESLGYRVLEAANGSEAIRRSFEYGGPIDLVLSDLLMPGIRGDSALKEIRAHRPDVKAIFVSGYADPDVARDTENILYKPFELPELGRRLRSVLDEPSPQSSAA
jgi:CheY-like chemotaxis protein